MFEIGKVNKLSIIRKTAAGVFLDGGEFGEILLPKSQAPENSAIGDSLDVFIYNDSEDELIATTKKPLGKVGDFAKLFVVSVNSFGAFLDWELPKDLLCPTSEQKTTMEIDRSYIVKIYLDQRTNRIVASAKLDKFLDIEPHNFKENQKVDLLICKQTDLGFKAIVNGTHWGVLYDNEVFQSLYYGQQLKGYIKKIRDDDKIDLTLYKPGYEKVVDVTDKIVNILKEMNGYIAITDKSSTQVIYNMFGESKRTYKKAIGALYKQKIIDIESKGIRLVRKPISNEPKSE
jgi:predicted RNA-binding protein (virulence factor B family)